MPISDRGEIIRFSQDSIREPIIGCAANFREGTRER